MSIFERFEAQHYFTRSIKFWHTCPAQNGESSLHYNAVPSSVFRAYNVKTVLCEENARPELLNTRQWRFWDALKKGKLKICL